MLNLAPLRERLATELHPFTIRLSGGWRFAIPHRDFIALVRGVISVGDRDVTQAIDPLQMASLQEATPQNGS